MKNPYGDGNAAPRIARVIEAVDLGPDFIKKRFDDWAELPGSSDIWGSEKELHG